MFKKLLILLTVSQMLLISVWANAHMSAEPHQAYESVHLHIESLFEQGQHNHSESCGSDDHGSHAHLCFCAFDFNNSKQLPQLIHAAPESFEYTHTSHQQSPPTPPPTL